MKHYYGFTLIELMVTLAIMVIVITVGIPSFNTVIRDNRLVSQYNDLVTALSLARSEAIKNTTTVTLCDSANNATCLNLNQWELGWIVFTDVNGNGAVDAGIDTILRVGAPIGGPFANGNNTLRELGFASTGNSVQYLPTGLMGGNTSGTFRVCDPRGAISARAVNINAVGRISRATDTDANNIVNGFNGADIVCP